MFALIAMMLAVVLAVGGFTSIQAAKQKKADNEKIAKELESIGDITVKEGEVLPSLKDQFDQTTMIDKNSIKADIQSVDVTVPGDYEIKYTFHDIKGVKRQKTISCTVTPDLEKHVDGLEDIDIELGEELPKADTTYDNYIDEVVRDDSKIDLEKAGSYPVTYTIIGTDGDMLEIEKTATIRNPVDKAKATVKKENDSTKTGNILNDQEESQTGNVEEAAPKEYTVPTSDNSAVIPYVLLFSISLFAMALGIRRFAKI